jgi:hypothetical protein
MGVDKGDSRFDFLSGADGREIGDNLTHGFTAF